MVADELRAELWDRMPGAGLTDAEVKAVFAPATRSTRAAPALQSAVAPSLGGQLVDRRRRWKAPSQSFANVASRSGRFQVTPGRVFGGPARRGP